MTMAKGSTLTCIKGKYLGFTIRFTAILMLRGVGLFISKYQAQAMGGDLRVESEEGVGSTFSLKIVDK